MHETISCHLLVHVRLFNVCPHYSYSCWCLDRIKAVLQTFCMCNGGQIMCLDVFCDKRWKSVMQSLINTCMIRNIELLSDCKSHRAPCLATTRSNTALLFLQRNVNFSPDRFISAHFRWIVGPGSALPSHPLSSSPLGPISMLELKINETRWQNSVYFKTSHLIWRSRSDLKLN